MTEIPHFRIPFDFIQEGGRVAAAETEQGSADEVFDCVQAIIRTQHGSRIENIDFGINQQEFKQAPLDLARLQADVLEWEPRANVVFSTQSDEFDHLIQRVLAEVHSGQTTTGAGEGDV